AINLFVVFGLDVTAGEEPVEAVPDPQVIPIPQRAGLLPQIVDERPIGAGQVGDFELAVVAADDLGVLPGHRRVRVQNRAVVVAADENRLSRERVAGPHLGAARVDVNEAGLLASAPDRLGFRGPESFNDVFRHRRLRRNRWSGYAGHRRSNGWTER